MATLHLGIYMVLLIAVYIHTGHSLNNTGSSQVNSSVTSTTAGVTVHVMVNNVSVSAGTPSTTTATTTTTTATTTTPDICWGVTCEHGGVCYGGTCSCSSGYTGDHCQTAPIHLPLIQPDTFVPVGAVGPLNRSSPASATHPATPSPTPAATPSKAPETLSTSPVGDLPVNNRTNVTVIINDTKSPEGAETGSNINSTDDVITNGTIVDDDKIVPGGNDVIVTTVAPSPCGSAPCLNGATCWSNGETFRCECDKSYNGSLCETAICSDPYLDAPINGQKSCSKQPQSFSDITCDVTCLHGYYFADGQRTHVYDCTDGLWLPSEKDVADCYRMDYCWNVTCQNNGTCEELWKDATCSCPPGFSGERCQIDEDECISAPCDNGGQCIDGHNGFLCQCAPGYGGPLCQTAILWRPVLTGVFPEYGPQAGGTLVTVTGEHLVVPIRHILLYLSDLKISAEQIEKRLCQIVMSNSTHIVARTPAVGEDLVRRYLPLAVELTGGAIYKSQLYFQYKPNPHISAIEPTDTIMAGGTLVTIIGTSLDSVAVPVLRITMVTTWRTITTHGQVMENRTTTVFKHPCELLSVVNKTIRVCRTPEVHVPDEFLKENSSQASENKSRQYRHLEQEVRNQPNQQLQGHKSDRQLTNSEHQIRHGANKLYKRRRREQSQSSSNTTELMFFLGFELDGVDTYLNISTVPELQEYSLFRVHRGPVIPLVHTPIVYSHLNDGPLYVNGSGLSQGVQMTDYTVTIGLATCVLLDLTDLQLSCQPPRDAPDMDPDHHGDYPVIMIYIGTNTVIRYGMLKYPSTIWIIVGPILGVLVVLLAIIIALLVLRRRIRNRNKHRKQHKYHYSPGEMIRLPAVQRAEFGEAFKIPGGSSGSLLVFQQDSSQGKGSPSHSRTSSALTTSADEFDGPEEFYENKEMIVRQQSHEAALEQFTGNPSKLSRRYTAEPQNSTEPKPQTPNNNEKSHPSGAKPQDRKPELETFSGNQNSYPSLRSFESGSNAGKPGQANTGKQEDTYVNNSVNPNPDQDIYENSTVQNKVPKKKKDKGPRLHRDPAKITHESATLPQPLSSIPPPVPNTPRPKLNITPKQHRPTTNGGHQGPHKHNSLSARPFEENPYTNSRTGDSDDDDIYVNSPIKARGLRTSGRGRRGRGAQRRRYEVNRRATLGY